MAVRCVVHVRGSRSFKTLRIFHFPTIPRRTSSRLPATKVNHVQKSELDASPDPLCAVARDHGPCWM